MWGRRERAGPTTFEERPGWTASSTIGTIADQRQNETSTRVDAYRPLPLSFDHLSPEEAEAHSRAFLELMSKRRSVRDFAPDEVPHGLVEDAIRYALDAGDVTCAREVVERRWPDAMDHQDWQGLGRWIRMLPEEEVQRSPILLALQAWLMIVRGNPQCDHLLARAREIALLLGQQLGDHVELLIAHGLEHAYERVADVALTDAADISARRCNGLRNTGVSPPSSMSSRSGVSRQASALPT